MPGQRKRKRRQEAERRRTAARTALDAGRWEVVFETHDQAELREHALHLRKTGTAESMIRIDMLCGRLVHPTAYRLSRFVPDPTHEPDREHSDH
ncbi:hypothetical protein ACFYXJ_04550 [Streptomyces sp. NPDC002667]|uniref:hypothetical protein n=1 Tax=Streptomyces sp. NPDC002667 TaxID=3364657 RepID=UPI0036CAA0F0